MAWWTHYKILSWVIIIIIIIVVNGKNYLILFKFYLIYNSCIAYLYYKILNCNMLYGSLHISPPPLLIYFFSYKVRYLCNQTSIILWQKNKKKYFLTKEQKKIFFVSLLMVFKIRIKSNYDMKYAKLKIRITIYTLHKSASRGYLRMILPENKFDEIKDEEPMKLSPNLPIKIFR